jgi:hypothetical protein
MHMTAGYNGWVGNGDRESAWATWNMALWADNDYAIYMERASKVFTTASDVEAFCCTYFPKGTPDMDPGDIDKVYWEEILEAWEAE